MSQDAWLVGLVLAAVLNVMAIRVALVPIQRRLDRVIVELELWRFQREDDDAERRGSHLQADRSA